MKTPQMTLSIVPIALLLVLMPPIAAAQEGLIDIYTRAMVNDPALREAEANYLVTAEARPQARSSLLPSIQFGTVRSFNDQSNTSPPLDFFTGQPSTVISGSESESNSRNLNLSLNQTVFDWGRYVSLRQADKTVARAQTDLAAARQDLLLRVANAYFNVLAAEDTLASEIAARESIARQLEQAQRRFEVGLIAITDVQEAQAGYDTSVAAEIGAERAVASSQEFLREIINDYVTDLRSPGDDLPLVNPDPANVEQWVQTAQEQNLALVASRINADIAQDEIAIQRSSRLPTINFSAGVTENNNSRLQRTTLFSGAPLPPNFDANPAANSTLTDGFNWSLNFSVPIYTGGINRSRIQQSVYRHRAAMETLERAARQTERETRDAYLGVISEISRVQALRQALESSQTALRATEAGFEVGTRTTVDVLNSQNNLSRAQTTYSRSRYDYILNVLRLKQAAGSLNEADISEVDGWLE
jgi:outer membrane protein